MKKKHLKNLVLHTSRISNLSLLHSTKGGTETLGTQVDNNVGLPNTIDATNCPTNILQCISQNFTDCSTNGGVTSTQPPTEYESCRPKNGNIIFR
ncbi:hypothetical protein [Kordia jejudonensis]|uniref:hypothetical protein n=1 Tax=Kordia jejudonensis TaxID=1348245 RepID=UPI0006296454|nr:hypothetical protein [Kordia jejudonensis]